MKLQLLIGVMLLSLEFATGQRLYVGANYHPHDDKNVEKVKRDIELMKEAGFTVVRMGHLAWDSYEPAEGKFDFAWFDQVPIWLHHKYPSVNITDASGNVLYPNHRYMVDVGDPMYQQYALRYTDMLTKRYAKHPALLAFGVDNESGDGPISYSQTVKERYIGWLKKKYSTVDSLNKAWAKGRAIYVGLPTKGEILNPLLDDLINELSLKKGLKFPQV